MTHERLSVLCLLNIESNVLKKIEGEEFIKDFSDAKSRKSLCRYSSVIYIAVKLTELSLDNLKSFAWIGSEFKLVV